ncbi:MAG: peptidoglycan editing factor PgeF [Ignavibacteriae bacterium]|nr:peptidoglycan editing factor PgeF [Ignavibacteriota bacterium]
MIPVIRSLKLSEIPYIRFAMSTRHGGVSPEPYGMNVSYKVGDSEGNVTANRQRLFEEVGIQQKDLALPKQCHSARALEVESGGQYESCDGLVSATPGIWLGISIADCVPVMLADRKRRAVAALHAGWRGTAQGIVGEGVRLMSQAFHTEPEDIVAFIGPSAGGCCYEVGEDVAAKFSPHVFKGRNGSYLLDLKKENKLQLQHAGIPEERIEISAYCTICTPNLFHSYRRDKERSGRMMALVGILSS